jgi:5S rRNA maturation endonuclease (ribonuclease M5)
MRYLNVGFKEACRWLGGNNVEIPSSRYNDITTNTPHDFDASRYERFFEHPFLNEEARKFLFEERRLDERVVRWCRLTSWKDRRGVPWLQTPYYSREGRLVGVQNRNLVRGGLPRFRFPQGAECTIYNLPVLNLLHPGDELWITEGCSDCWAMLSAGHKAIAIPSATLLKKKDIEQLSIINSQLSIGFHMFPDRDAPGERLFLQLQQVLPNLVHHQLPSDCKDFSEYYLKEIKPP